MQAGEMEALASLFLSRITIPGVETKILVEIPEITTENNQNNYDHP